ncbi:aspartate--tRNA ligase 2, cytoplasmic, partial [Tanacetum coccineum]
MSSTCFPHMKTQHEHIPLRLKFMKTDFGFNIFHEIRKRIYSIVVSTNRRYATLARSGNTYAVSYYYPFKLPFFCYFDQSLLKKWRNRFKFAFAVKALNEIKVYLGWRVVYAWVGDDPCGDSDLPAWSVWRHMLRTSVVNIFIGTAAGKQVVRVNQDTRLNNTVLDVRTPTNQSIFSLENKLLNLFGQLLRSKDFWQIITPNIIAGS